MGENFPYSTDKEDEDEEDGERNRNRKEKDSGENETRKREENGRSNNLRTVEEEEGDEEDNEREGRRKKGANTKNTPPTYPILKEPPTLPPHLLKLSPWGTGGLFRLSVFVAVNYAIAKWGGASLWTPVLTWSWNVIVVASCDYYDGYRLAPLLGPSFAWLDKDTGVIRWAIYFNMATTR